MGTEHVNLEALKTARQNGERRSAPFADLRGADLSYTNLRGADLRHTNLSYANLRGADLYGADLRHTNLSYANLYCAELSYANLYGADLSNADLRDADLWGGMAFATPSGSGYLIPTVEGWRVTIGCWSNKTLEDLKDLVADRAPWPEATGAERESRRPILVGVLTLCEAHAEYHADKITDLIEKWGT